MSFLHNAWYIAARRADVTSGLLRRVILNEPVLLYRTADNQVAAIQDRCPHRFAPLSMGTLKNDVVECKYHGLQFDKSGVCVGNPQGQVSSYLNIRGYKAVERHGFVWVWAGDVANANADTIPNLSALVAPGTQTVFNYFRADYRHDILVDNLVDLSHVDYLHVGSFSGGKAEYGELQVNEVGDDVVIKRTQLDSPPPPYLPDAGRVDIHTDIHWHPGHVISFEIRVSPVGQPETVLRTVNFGHVATPETKDTTHYFLWSSRDYQLDDPAVDAMIAARQVGVIQREDGPMLEAVHAQMGGQELSQMRPVVLPADAGGLRVRRVMKRLLEQELSQSTGVTATT